MMIMIQRQRMRRIMTMLSIIMMLLVVAVVHRRGAVFSVFSVVSVVSASTAAGSETLIGIRGRDFVVIGADSSVRQSIAVTASNIDKIAVIVDPFPTNDANVNANTANANTANANTANANVDANGHPPPPHDPTPAHNNNNNTICGGANAGQPQQQQQCILAAVAGDAADGDRLIGLLKAHATIREFEGSVGCDVEYVDCSSRSSRRSRPESSLSASAPTFLSTTDSDSDSASASASARAGLSVRDVAYLARNQITDRLRSRAPLRVCALVAGLMPVRRRRRRMRRRIGPHEDARLPRIYVPTTTRTRTRTRTTTTTTTKRIIDARNDPNDTHADYDDDSTMATLEANQRVQYQVDQGISILHNHNHNNNNNNNKNSASATSEDEPPWYDDIDMDMDNGDVTNSPRKLCPTMQLQPQLYWLDEYGALQCLAYGAHGYGSMFIHSILDRGYRPDLTLEEAIALLQSCFTQLQTRYVVNAPHAPCIKFIIDRGRTSAGGACRVVSESP